MAPYTAVVLLQLRQMDLASYWKRRGLVSCPRNKHIFRCDQNGPPARRKEGAYPERYVTDEQRSRRPIFIATLWAATSWLFFRVARSSRIALDMIVARALKNRQLTGGEGHAYFGDRTLGPPPLVEAHKLFFKLGAWRGCLLLMTLQF